MKFWIPLVVLAHDGGKINTMASGGRKVFGFLNINKPTGISSRRVVDMVERRLDTRKVGHAGTLDPLASGVLVIAVGPATRLIRFAQQMPKRYRAKFMMGAHSASDDIEQPFVREPDPVVPDRSALETAIAAQIGIVQQVPPAFSAVKIGGRRAYRLARVHQPVTLAPRPVTIYEIELIEFEYPFFEIDVRCGSGTYVRSLGRDICQPLATRCVMTELRRTAIGNFDVRDSIDFAELESIELIERVAPPLEVLREYPQVICRPAEIQAIADGVPFKSTETAEKNYLIAVDPDGRLIAVMAPAKEPGIWNPKINFAPLLRNEI